jgi:hypothetical protein
MFKNATRRLARMGLALAAAAVTMLAATGTALARGPFPLRAVRSGMLTTGPAFPVVVIPIALCIAIAVIVVVSRRQSRATQAAARPTWLPSFTGSREDVDAKAKRAA